MSEQIQGIREAVATATAGLTAEQLTRHLQPEKWSVVEILEHLMLTYTGTTKGLERCVTENKSLATRQSFMQRLLTYLISRLGYFPEGRDAPKQVKPKGTPADDVLPTLLGSLDQLDAALDEAQLRFGNGKVLDHPLLGAFSAADWRGFHASHAKHHIKQIVAMRSHLG